MVSISPVSYIKRVFYVAYAYPAFYLGLSLLGFIGLAWAPFALLFDLILPGAYAAKLGRWAIACGFRGYLRMLVWLGISRFDLTALDVLKQQAPLILAPNHPCLLDAVMVLSRLPNVVCIMKSQLMNNVFLGAGARLAGYIRNDALRPMTRSALFALKNGQQLLMFPEGTRTVYQPVNPFGGGIGLIACRGRVPVQTILIETNSPFLGKGWPLFKCPALPVTYTVRLGQRFVPPRDAHVLVKQLEQYFRSTLADRPPMPGLQPHSESSQVG